ncbi:MAG: hypothetical protein ACYSW8_23920, partial [Planctomycetota bacterium]
CRVTCKQSPAGTWTLGGTTDLRGVLPGAVAGSAAGGGAITDFSDNLFTIYNVSDVTKILDFDLSGLTTSTTRTVTASDAAMTIPDTVNWTDLTDAGVTTLHTHSSLGDASLPMQLIGVGAAATFNGSALALTSQINYALVSGNDAGTDITAAELEELSDGSTTTLHDHTVTGLTGWIGPYLESDGSTPLTGDWSVGTPDIFMGGNLYLDKTNDPSLFLRTNGSTTGYTQIQDSSATGMLTQKFTASGSAAYIDFAPMPADGTSHGYIRMFRQTNTTGNSTGLYIYDADGTSAIQHSFVANGGNVSLCQQGGKVICGGVAVQLPYLGAAPSGLTNGMIWMESDGLHIYYAGAEKVVAGV